MDANGLGPPGNAMHRFILSRSDGPVAPPGIDLDRAGALALRPAAPILLVENGRGEPNRRQPRQVVP